MDGRRWQCLARLLDLHLSAPQVQPAERGQSSDRRRQDSQVVGNVEGVATQIQCVQRSQAWQVRCQPGDAPITAAQVQEGQVMQV